MPRTRLGRWLALVCLVAICSIAGLAGLGWAAITWIDDGMSSQSDLTTHTLDENTARSSLDESGVVIPEEFRFVGGLNQPSGFPGTPSNYVRFDGPVGVFNDSGSVSAVNRKFLLFRDVKCDVRNRHLETLGMTCTPTTRMRVSYSSEVSSAEYMQPGTEALVLVADREVTHLYVLVEGT